MKKQNLKTFKFSSTFFIIMVYVAFSMFLASYNYLNALHIIESNQHYTYIGLDQERRFNEWDLKRISKISYIFGIFCLVISIVHLLLSINFDKFFRRKK